MSIDGRHNAIRHIFPTRIEELNDIEPAGAYPGSCPP
jgi:hypothetical protein